jgi:tetratricopeptide (TPR) repeat protein
VVLIDRRAVILAEAEAAYKGVLGDPTTYGPRAAELVERARRLRDSEAVVVALHAQARAEHERMHNVAAKRLLDSGIRLARRHGLTTRVGELLVSRVAVLHELGRLAAAQRDVQTAAGILPPAGQAGLLLQQAVLAHNAGSIRPAAVTYRRLVGDSAAPAEIRAKAANNLALVEADLGRPEAALHLLDLAADLGGGVGPTLRASLLQNRAWVTVRTGRLAASLALFDTARALFDEAGMPAGEQYAEYSDALADLRLLPEALDAARQAVALLAAEDASLMSAEAALRVARLELATGDRAAATVTAARAADTLRRQRRPAWVARAVVVVELARTEGQDPRTLRRCAAVLEREGLKSDAVEAHLAAGRSAAAAGAVDAAVRSLQSAARLSLGAPVLVRLKGRLAAAEAGALAGAPPAGVVAVCRAGLDDLARHRSALPSMELRALASGHGAALGVLGLRALRPGSTPARVFRWLERTRAAALSTVTPGGGAAQEDLAQLRALHTELAEEKRSSGSEPPGLVARIAAQENRIRRRSWSGEDRGSTVDQPVGPAQLRPLVGAGALVEYGLLDGQLLAVVVTASPLRLVDLGAVDVVAADVETLMFALRRLARPGLSPRRAEGARASADAALAGLRRRLVAPLGVDPEAPLVVVPVGPLQRVAWSPLHAGRVEVAPSAASWARTASAVRTAELVAASVALVAGPGLPGATEEVHRLADVHPGATVLTPPDGTCAAVLSALNGARLAHLACHSSLRADNPTFSSLLLHDGPLTVHELASGGTTPQQVVLAACESAVQAGYPGDETLGFVSALLAHGTRGLVASTVLVPDVDAVALMVALHEQLAAGASTATALHRARAGVDVDAPGAFAAWCAFTAFGAA